MPQSWPLSCHYLTKAFAQDIFIIRASEAALHFFDNIGIFRNQGVTRRPPPPIKLSLLLYHYCNISPLAGHSKMDVKGMCWGP